MGDSYIKGVKLTSLKIFTGEPGNVYHAMKATDVGYSGFGEAYFSTVNHGAVKGWKKHTIMVSNLIVPVGAVKFVLYDNRPESPTKDQFMEVILSIDTYLRLTVPPGVWMGFQGNGKDLNMVLNIASIAHNPAECITEPINSQLIPYYSWA